LSTHRVDAVLKPLVFGLMALDHLLYEAATVILTRVRSSSALRSCSRSVSASSAPP
jgi:hypothetical protein